MSIERKVYTADGEFVGTASNEDEAMNKLRNETNWLDNIDEPEKNLEVVITDGYYVIQFKPYNQR